MSDADQSPDSLADLYERLKPAYRAFVDKLESHLEERLDEVAPYAWISSWTLPVDGYWDLLARNRKAHSETSSCAGVNVVTYKTSYFEDIVSFLHDEFLVDTEASGPVRPPDRQALDTEPVEYAHPRYVVCLTEERAALPEWKPYDGLSVEIDVMTILHDAWERIDRNLPFYWAGAYPAQTRKLLDDAITHVSAVDWALTEFEKTTDAVRLDYAEAIRGGSLELELNGESLRSYLIEAKTVSELTDMAVEAGMRRGDEEPSWQSAEELLWLIRVSGIGTLRELDRFLHDAFDRAPALLGQITLLAGERDFVPWALPDWVVLWLLLVLHRADATTVQLTGNGDALKYALNTLIGNRVGSEDRPQNHS